jgi:serine/threonine-protein kinase RsbW
MSVTATLRITSRLAAIDEARRWVGGQLADRDQESVWEVELALTEALSNVIRHAYDGDESRQIELALELDGERLVLEIAHDGKPFDPASYRAPDPPRPGGYGLSLIDRLVDEVEHDGTRLCLVKRLPLVLR